LAFFLENSSVLTLPFSVPPFIDVGLFTPSFHNSSGRGSSGFPSLHTTTLHEFLLLCRVTMQWFAQVFLTDLANFRLANPLRNSMTDTPLFRTLRRTARGAERIFLDPRGRLFCINPQLRGGRRFLNAGLVITLLESRS